MTQRLSGWERWLEAPYALDLIGWAREVHDAEGYVSLRIEDRWWTWLPGHDRIWGPFAASPDEVRGWDVPRLLGVPLERIARELGGQWTVTSSAYATLWEGEPQRYALYGEVTPCWDGQVCRPFKRATLTAPAPSGSAQPVQGDLLLGRDPATGGGHLGFFVPPDRQLLASPSQSAGSPLVVDPQGRYASLRRYGRWWALLLDGQGSAYGPCPLEDPHEPLGWTHPVVGGLWAAAVMARLQLREPFIVEAHPSYCPRIVLGKGQCRADHPWWDDGQWRLVGESRPSAR